MKNHMLRRAFSLVLCMMLVLSLLSACGKKNEAGGGASAGAGEGNQGASTFSEGSPESSQDEQVYSDDNSYSVPEATGNGEVTIYKVGTDRIAVIIKSDLCENIKENANCNFYIDGGEASSATLEASYASLGRNKDGNWESVQADQYYGGLLYGKNMYYVEFSGENIDELIPDSGNYDFRFYSSTSGNTEVLGSGDYSSIVKKLDEASANEAIAAELSAFAAAEPAKVPWTGSYVTDDYSDNKGFINMTVLPGGLVHVQGKLNGKVVDFFSAESEYSEQNYDYGSYISGVLKTRSQDIEMSVSYTQEPEYTNITFNSNDYKTGDYGYANLYKFTGVYNAKPDGYVDEDRYGIIASKDPGDDQYFKPATDNYIIKFYEKSSKYYNGGDFPCMNYILTSYDENDMPVQNISKCVFENASDAQTIVDDINGRTYKYSEGHISGNIVYEDYTEFSMSPKEYDLGYDWYVDCHYCYPNYTYNDARDYMYVSKPITQAEKTVSLEDMVFWMSVPSGTHHSFESADAELYASVGRSSASFSIYDYREESMLNSIGNLKFHGRTAEAITYTDSYDEGDYQHYVAVKEFKFDEEKAYVTEYRYKVKDFKNVDITLDNYKSKTPDKTLELTFDMKNAS